MCTLASRRFSTRVRSSLSLVSGCPCSPNDCGALGCLVLDSRLCPRGVVNWRPFPFPGPGSDAPTVYGVQPQPQLQPQSPSSTRAGSSSPTPRKELLSPSRERGALLGAAAEEVRALAREPAATQAPIAQHSTGTFLFTWGSRGCELGQLHCPGGICAFDNRVFVADSGNNRVCVFDQSGRFLLQWGSKGSGVGQFSRPDSICIDANGERIFVSDVGNHRICLFDARGVFIRQWGKLGTRQGEFCYPKAIAVSTASERVYVADRDNERVKMFDCDGRFVGVLAPLCVAGEASVYWGIPRGLCIWSPLRDTWQSRIHVRSVRSLCSRMCGGPRTRLRGGRSDGSVPGQQ